MRWLVLLLLSLVFSSSSVQAQDASTVGTPRSDHPDVLQQAVEAYQAGDLVTARLLFERLHAENPTARTLRSLGLVAFRAGRFDEAESLLAQSLVNPVKPLTEAMRADAAKLIAEIQAQRIPPPAVPELPSETPASGPPAAERPSDHPSSATMTPERVERPGPRSSANNQGHKPAPRMLPSPRPARTRRLRAGYTLAALGSAALAGSAIATLIGVARLEGIEEVCRSHESGQCFESEARERKRAARLELLSGLSFTGLIFGGVSATGGATLLFLHYRSQSSEHGTQRVSGFTLQRNF